MTNRRRRYPRSRPRRGPSFYREREVRLQPAVDPKLRSVLSQIGRPKKRPFAPDAFQLEAIEAVRTNDCLVTVPTGAGKTWVAEMAIEEVLKSGGRAWYASPLKALTNAKYREFGERFGPERVGILTGDRKEFPDAPVITGTTEILRNQLYDAMSGGQTLNTDFVILDEAHFLGDPERGVVWEEIMIYLPQRIPLLLLSATIGNADQIASWLEAHRQKPCRVVRDFRRPVPLRGIFLHPSGTLMPLTVPTKNGSGMKTYRKVQEYAALKNPPLLAPPRRLPPLDEVLRVLEAFHLLPAIFFLKSRADCDAALQLVARSHSVSDPRSEEITRQVAALSEASPHLADHRQRIYLERHAVGAHHSGQLPGWKLLLETLMTRGQLDAIFATSTVAAGVNFPARTVVFLNSDKYNGREFLPLTPTEFHQMTGRAGRRGMDRIGFAVMLPGQHMNLEAMAHLMSAAPSDVMSQIHINFSMVLNLLLSHTPPEIEDLLTRSFAAYQIETASNPKKMKKRLDAGQRYIAEDFKHRLQFLQAFDYVDDHGRLTEDGRWAAQLRVDHPLAIAQGFRAGIFPDDDPSLLAALMAPFVYEKELDGRIDRAMVPKVLRQAFARMAEALEPFFDAMDDWGFDTRPFFIRPAAAVFAWTSGKSWEMALLIAEMEEGNLVSLMLRTADNLRHIRGLRDVFPKAADTADAAIGRILREPVQINELV